MFQGRRRLALQCRQSSSATHQSEFTSQAVRAQCQTEFGRGFQQFGGGVDIVELITCDLNFSPQCTFFSRPFFAEGSAVVIERFSQTNNLDSGGYIAGRSHVDREAESILKLWAELSLFGVTAADQHKLRRVSHTQPLSLNDVLSGSSDIEERIHDVVLQQIHFVDIQEATIRLCQETWLKRFLAVDECALNIQSADDAVFC